LRQRARGSESEITEDSVRARERARVIDKVGRYIYIYTRKREREEKRCER